MRKKKNEIKIVCEKCGKTAPIDTEKSNSNWTVYNVKEPCECGGRFSPKLVEDIYNAT